MKQLEQTIEAMQESLNPYGLYLQRRPTAFPVSIAQTNGQNFNFEPYVALVVVFAISEFFKGFFGNLGGRLAEYLSNAKKHGKATEQLDLRDLVRELEEDIRLMARTQLSETDLSEATNLGLKRVQTHLIQAGLPDYRADELVSQWRTSLLSLLDSVSNGG